jgi:DNA-binding Xre family transcriptional regulator
VNRHDWRAVAIALNARMAERRIRQQELADLAGVSVATLRVLQHGAGGRRVQDATLAAVCRALDWPSDHLTRVLLGYKPAAADTTSAAVSVDTQAEILAVLRRIEAHVEGIARTLTTA